VTLSTSDDARIRSGGAERNRGRRGGANENPAGLLYELRSPVVDIGACHPQTRTVGDSVTRSSIHPLGRRTEELRVDEVLEKLATGRLVQPPQALRLLAREAETRHFQKLTADTLQHAVVDLGARLPVHVRPPN
jgi:hypothetical protein